MRGLPGLKELQCSPTAKCGVVSLSIRSNEGGCCARVTRVNKSPGKDHTKWNPESSRTSCEAKPPIQHAHSLTSCKAQPPIQHAHSLTSCEAQPPIQHAHSLTSCKAQPPIPRTQPHKLQGTLRQPDTQERSRCLQLKVVPQEDKANDRVTPHGCTAPFATQTAGTEA
jgi:hypothetical protein